MDAFKAETDFLFSSFIFSGRPKWGNRFQAGFAAAHPKGEIGVAYCRNPLIECDLIEAYYKYRSVKHDQYLKMHKENV